MPIQIQLTMDEKQAQTTAFALDLCSRLLSGQLEEVAALIRQGHIPMFQAQQAPAAVCDEVTDLVRRMKASMGYPINGHHGLGHPLTPPMGDRAYEVMKVLKKALADESNPHQRSTNVDHDGLTVRYTQDPEPRAMVIRDLTSSPGPSVLF